MQTTLLRFLRVFLLRILRETDKLYIYNMKRILTLLLACLLVMSVRAQEKWDLKRSIEYAVTNNISVKQQDVQARIVALSYFQSKASLYPSANLNGNIAYSTGRNQNPVTFDLITQGYLSSGFTLQAAVDIFNWYSKKNTVAGNRLETAAAFANVEKLRNDIALNVAGAYLQAVLYTEQVRVTEVQVRQSKAQLENTRKLVSAGSLPELNAAQLEAQLASDSANLVTAQGNVAQGLLLLKALLSLDAGSPFEIASPDVTSIPLEDIASLQPEAVYNLAVQNLPQQKSNDLRIEAAQKFVAAARAARYPSFSGFGSLSTRFNNRASEVVGYTTVIAPVGSVNVGGTPYNVFPLDPIRRPEVRNITYLNQLNQNFGQTVGISMSVPIANGGVLRAGYERSKLNLRAFELQRESDNLSLKQDIYKAYTDVITSLQKFNAAGKLAAAAQKAYDFAGKRYDVGLLNTLDLITTQNTLYSAKLQQLLAQYDYVFKMKVLEFYKGQGLKL